MLTDRSYTTRIWFVPVVETEDGVKVASVFGRQSGSSMVYVNHNHTYGYRAHSSIIRGHRSAGRERGVGLVSHAGVFRSTPGERGDPRGRRADAIRCIGQRVSDVFKRGSARLPRTLKGWVQVLTRPNSSPVEQNFLDSLQSGVGQAFHYFQEKVTLLFPGLSASDNLFLLGLRG